MDYPIFDTHAHYDDEAFNDDRDALLKSLPEQGVGKVVDIAASVESLEQVTQLSHQYDHVYCALGIHPEEVGAMDDAVFARLSRLASQEEKCLAIGEIGLDYYWQEVPRDVQKDWFVRQLDLARELQKPVVIHSREAAADTIDIMKQQHAEEIGGVVHCYSYSVESAKIFYNMGFYFGIGGVLTYKNARKLVEAVDYIPMDRIVLETDCPYLSPVPNRGKRNSSLNIPYVVDKIAEIKGISPEEVRRITWENAHKLYRIEQD